MCSKSLKGMAIVKLYKNIKISEASAAPENRFLMRCTVSGVHLTGGMLLHDNRAFIGLSNLSAYAFFVKKMFIMHNYTESNLDKLMNFH